MNAKQMTRCNKCGCECFWDTNRNGKRYLAQSNEKEYDRGTGSWKSPHYCTATEEDAAEYQATLQRQKDAAVIQHAADIAKGEIVVGQTVKVYRGRKVPQGIIGVVFWVAEEADAFDVWKIGIKVEQGDKHFLSISNVDFYFDGADALNDSRVAEAKEHRKLAKEAKLSGVEIEF